MYFMLSVILLVLDIGLLHFKVNHIQEHEEPEVIMEYLLFLKCMIFCFYYFFTAYIDKMIFQALTASGFV